MMWPFGKFIGKQVNLGDWQQFEYTEWLFEKKEKENDTRESKFFDYLKDQYKKYCKHHICTCKKCGKLINN